MSCATNQTLTTKPKYLFKVAHLTFVVKKLYCCHIHLESTTLITDLSIYNHDLNVLQLLRMNKP